jgi:hypothetical protein
MHVNFQGAKIEYKMNKPYNSANYSKQKQLQILFLFRNEYSLRSILPFANTDISRHILVLDASVFTKGNMGQRE